RPPRGTSGLTQSLLALFIASLVAIALVTTLVSAGIDSSDLRKTIVTSLLSVLATIAGFYFGARTAQTSTEQATRPPVPAPRHMGPPNGQAGARGAGGATATQEQAGTDAGAGGEIAPPEQAST